MGSTERGYAKSEKASSFRTITSSSFNKLLNLNAMSTSQGPTSDNVSGLRRLTPWEKKVEQRQRDDAVKTKEREMKAEREREIER